MDINKVIPKRVYTHENETIVCREIISKVLFTLSVSEGTAKMLMKDLYYNNTQELGR